MLIGHCKKFKADGLSISPSSEQMEESWVVCVVILLCIYVYDYILVSVLRLANPHLSKHQWTPANSKIILDYHGVLWTSTTSKVVVQKKFVHLKLAIRHRIRD